MAAADSCRTASLKHSALADCVAWPLERFFDMSGFPGTLCASSQKRSVSPYALLACASFIFNFHHMAETLFQYQQVSQVISEMHKIVMFFAGEYHVHLL